MDRMEYKGWFNGSKLVDFKPSETAVDGPFIADWPTQNGIFLMAMYIIYL